MRSSPVFVVVAAGVVLLGGCPPAEGGSCDTDRYECVGTALALECRSGTWREIPCRGPEGCLDQDGFIHCDVEGSRVGDACGDGHEGWSVCTPDGKALLECRGGTW